MGGMVCGTGDEGLYIMVDMKNRCSGDDSVIFSHHSPWFIVVCTLSERPVMRKRAGISKHTIIHT